MPCIDDGTSGTAQRLHTRCFSVVDHSGMIVVYCVQLVHVTNPQLRQWWRENLATTPVHTWQLSTDSSGCHVLELHFGQSQFFGGFEKSCAHLGHLARKRNAKSMPDAGLPLNCIYRLQYMGSPSFVLFIPSCLLNLK
jgi:hypothetical protein